MQANFAYGFKAANINMFYDNTVKKSKHILTREENLSWVRGLQNRYFGLILLESTSALSVGKVYTKNVDYYSVESKSS